MGTEVSVTGSATDVEDGDLTASILWEDMATRPAARLTGNGGTFTFTPTMIGTHPLRATVIDSNGGRRQAIVRITATGEVPQVTPVQMDPSLPGTGGGIDLDPTGLQARWTIAQKMGIRANQGMIGDFQYFEVQRLGPPIDQGAGVAAADGPLNPYVSFTGPQSMSLNTLGGLWQNLTFLQPYDTEANSTYGFAVDYRGVNPTVYVIMATGVVLEYVMYDAFTPVHPMLFGSLTPTAPGSYDIQIQFTGPFVLDPAAALTSWGVPAADVAALTVGWEG